MTKSIQVLVIGGTGTLGRQIAKRAADEGFQVRCMVRSPRKAAFLQEWGCELTQGDLLKPEEIEYALEGVDAVIDAATARPDDSKSVYEIDWNGKLNLYRACDKNDVKRVIFLSLLGSENNRDVPLMDIKYCTERLLIESNLDYTILQGVAFMQGVIGQFAIPIIDSQTVWISSKRSEIAYMNTQDVAKFAVRSLQVPESIRKVFPIVGPKGWTAAEVIKLCERASDKKAKVLRVSPFLIELTQALVSLFQPTLSVAERLSFAKVTNGDTILNSPMQETYNTYGLNPDETTKLEDYIKEYYSMIIKRLREMEADLDIEAKKKLPF